ncbi:hypothetical protein KI387_024001, partial [Taxus chinensis]
QYGYGMLWVCPAVPGYCWMYPGRTHSVPTVKTKYPKQWLKLQQLKLKMSLGNVGSKNTVAASPQASKTNAGIIRETPKESELPDFKGA